jgi:uncharacterized protein YbjT (DUF2867 family)
MRILVTGATGTVGRHVVTSLVDEDITDENVTVRAGVRDIARARERFGDEIEYAEFDFQRPETWGAAFDGIDALFLIRPPTIGRVKRHITPAIDAAARVGVEHVVFLSVLGAERNPILPHRRIEAHLRDADVSHTFLRASFFMQNLAEVHREAIAERDEIFVPAGNGKTSFVDARDIGAVAAVALTEPDHENRAYDITGPAAFDYATVAEIFSDVLGRPIGYANPSIPAFVRRLRAEGQPLAFVLVMVGIYTIARLGFAGRVSRDIEALIGREPIPLERFVADYADAFESSQAE